MYSKILIAVGSAVVAGATGYAIGRRNKEVNRIKDEAAAQREMNAVLDQQRRITERKVAAERDLQNEMARIHSLSPSERAAREQALREELVKKESAERIAEMRVQTEHLRDIKESQRRAEVDRVFDRLFNEPTVNIHLVKDVA